MTEISIDDLTGEDPVSTNLTIDYYVPKNVTSSTLSLLQASYGSETSKELDEVVNP